MFVFQYDDSLGFKQIISKKLYQSLQKDKSIGWEPLKSVQNYCKNLYQIRLLKNKVHRLNAQIKHIERDIANHTIRMCFGSKTLFKQQHLVNSNNQSARVHKSHVHWLLNWYDSRAHQIYLTGG